VNAIDHETMKGLNQNLHKYLLESRHELIWFSRSRGKGQGDRKHLV